MNEDVQDLNVEENFQDEESNDYVEVSEDEGGSQEEDFNEAETNSPEEEEQYTEKGTKLDPNPQSAIHQQLANERRARLELERQFQLLAQQQSQQAQPQQPQQPQQFVDPSKIQTREDVAQYLNEVYRLAEAQRQANEQLYSQLNSFQQQAGYEKNISTFESEVGQVRQEYSELNPDSRDYSQALDDSIAMMYQQTAYDENGYLKQNRPSLVEFTKAYMRGISQARQSGSKQAQTRVVQKQMGARPGNAGKISKNTDNLSPEDYIALEMEKLGL